MAATQSNHNLSVICFFFVVFVLYHIQTMVDVLRISLKITDQGLLSQVLCYFGKNLDNTLVAFHYVYVGKRKLSLIGRVAWLSLIYGEEFNYLGRAWSRATAPSATKGANWVVLGIWIEWLPDVSLGRSSRPSDWGADPMVDPALTGGLLHPI